MDSSSFTLGKIVIYPKKSEIRTPIESFRVEPRLIQLLQLLAKSPGETVTKQEIADQVWAPKEMSDESLAQAISQLRKYLGDSAAKPQFIHTIPKIGYLLDSDVASNAHSHIASEPSNHQNDRTIQFILIILCIGLGGLLLVNMNGNQGAEIEEIEIERENSLTIQ